LDITGPVDVTLFERALRQVVSEAEALRLRFGSASDGPYQFIVDQLDSSMPFIDVSGSADPAAAAERRMRADLARPIDLTSDTLFGFALFKVASDRFFWYARYHHIVADGVGLALVAKRVSEVYSALAVGLSGGAGNFGSLPLLLEDDAAYRASDQ